MNVAGVACVSEFDIIRSMSQEQFLNFGIMAVAIVLLLVGLSMLFGGLFGRNRRGQYQVQRFRAQRNSMIQALRGVAVLALGAALFGVGFYFQYGTTQRASAVEPTLPTATQAPVQEPTVQSLPTATAEPLPTATATVVAEEEATAVPPPATPTAVAPEPTPTATTIPTATPIPYDAYVNVVGGLNMRDTPNGLVTVLLPNGTGMTMLNQAIAAGPFLWQKVLSESGDEGWVAEDFIEYAP